MSPKKSKKHGRKKDSKRKDDPNKLSELDKETYSVQIESLTSKLQGYEHPLSKNGLRKQLNLQMKCQELDAANSGYKSELDQLTANKRDIVDYLQSVSSKRADEIQELSDRLEGMRQARETDHKAHDLQLGQLKSQFRETIDQLTSENIVLSGKLASLEEFKAQREETVAKIEELQNDLKVRDEEHRETIRLLEKSRILEKDELKKEMAEKLEEIGRKFRQTSNRQMAETTRRAIKENVALMSQMDAMERKITSIVAENQNLIDIKQRQQVQIATLEGMEQDLHKRNLALSKIVKDQELKLNDYEEVASDLKPYHEKSIRLEDDLRSIQSEVENLKSECEALRSSSKSTEAELVDVRNRYDAICVKHQSMKSVLCNASVALRDGIVFGHGVERDDTLSSLLTILHVADVTDSPSVPRKLSLPSSNPSKGSTKTRYLSGDVGIVPLETRSRRHQRMHTVATQTKHPHPSFDLPPLLFQQLRAVKSAAYKILHDVKCPTRNFYDSRNSLIPRLRFLEPLELSSKDVNGREHS